MNGQGIRKKIEALNPKLQAFKKPESAAIQKLHHKVVWIGKVIQYWVNFFPGQNNRNILFPLCPDDTINFSEFLPQNIAEKEQKCIESLVLSGSRDLLLDCQEGQKIFNIPIWKQIGCFTFCERLKLSYPKLIYAPGFIRIMANYYLIFQALEFFYPGCSGYQAGGFFCLSCFQNSRDKRILVDGWHFFLEKFLRLSGEFSSLFFQLPWSKLLFHSLETTS